MRWLPTDYAVRNLGRSPLRLVLSLLGSCLVVLLMMAAAAFVAGMQKTSQAHPDSDRVIVLGAGSEESTERSEISARVPGILTASLPGVREELGQPCVSPEIHMMAVLRLAKDGAEELDAILRGVTPAVFRVHDHLRLVEGRFPRIGEDELMVGVSAGLQLGVPEERLELGQELWFDGRPWRIVGRFDAARSILGGEVWMPLVDLQIVAQRDTLSCVILRLGEAEFADLDVLTKIRLDLELVALTEASYFEGLRRFFEPIEVVVWITALLIALGGVLGGLNTMVAAFASRVRELGMLRTLGYPRRAIVVSLATESMLLAVAGGILGSLLAQLFLDGLAVRFSLGTFGLLVDARVQLIGFVTSLFLGLLGALPACWRCLRMPIPEALKSP